MYGGGSWDSAFNGSGAAWFEGEPKGRSEVGDDESEEDRDDGKEGRDEVAGVGGIDVAVMVADRSRPFRLAIVVNCPLYRG